jgi:hypothetical protein
MFFMPMGWDYVSELLPLTDIFFILMIWVWTLVEWYWQGETEELGEKPVPVPLCPPQITHGLTGREPGPPRWKAGDCLSHGTASPRVRRVYMTQRLCWKVYISLAGQTISFIVWLHCRVHICHPESLKPRSLLRILLRCFILCICFSCSLFSSWIIQWFLTFVSRGSSVSIVSGYGLDYRAVEVRSPAEAGRFFL